MPYRSLADFPDLVASLLVKGEPSNRNALVKAPCCGFVRSASTVIDVRDIPGTVVHAGGIRPPVDQEWLCDGCRRRMVRDHSNDWSESKLLEAREAPAQYVHRWRAREETDRAKAEAFRRGESFSPGAYFAAALQRIVGEHREAALAAAASA